MAAMSKFKNQREAERIMRDEMMGMLAMGERVTPTDILCRSGNTIRLTVVDGKIVKTIIAGHVTHGMSINPSDLPCVCS